MIATILSLNGGLLTTILCIHNQYFVTINSQIKLSVCLSVCQRLGRKSPHLMYGLLVRPCSFGYLLHMEKTCVLLK